MHLDDFNFRSLMIAGAAKLLSRAVITSFTLFQFGIAGANEISRLVDASGGSSSNGNYLNIGAIGEGGPVGSNSNGELLNYSGFMQGFVALPPIAGPNSLERASASALKVRWTDLLTNDSVGPNGGPLQILGLGAPTSGLATLTSDAVYVYYTPNAGFTSPDQFTYYLTDAGGVSATGVVQIGIKNNPGATPQVALGVDIIGGTGDVLARFVGIPGFTYRIQEADTLVAPVWQDAGSTTADSRGDIELQFTPSFSPAFFRVVYP